MKKHLSLRKWITRWLILWPLLVGVLFIRGGYQFFKKDISDKVISFIKNYSQTKLPVIMNALEFEVYFLSPTLVFKSVIIEKNRSIQTAELNFSKSINDLSFNPVKIKEIQINLDLFQLIGGNIFVSNLMLSDPQIDLNIDFFTTEADKEEPLQWEKWNNIPLLNLLKTIPLYRLAISNLDLNVFSKKNNLTLHVDQTNILTLNSRDRLSAQIQINKGVLIWDRFNLPFDLIFDGLLTQQKLNVSSFQIKTLDSQFSLTGEARNIHQTISNSDGSIKMSLYSNLPLLSNTFKNSIKNFDLQGWIKINNSIEWKGIEHIQSKVNFTSEKLKINEFLIGDVHFDALLDPKKLSSPRLTINHTAGIVTIDHFIFQWLSETSQRDLRVSGLVQSKKLDLHELLKQLDVGDLPLGLFIDAKLDCGGPILPPYTLIKCDGTASGKDLEVFNSVKANKKRILLLNDFTTTGSISVTHKEVKYFADIQINNNIGESNGVINYQTGFNIAYKTPRLNLSHISDLYGFKLEGFSQLDGSIHGDSDYAEFFINILGQDLYFEDYFLGNPMGKFRYQKSILFFEKFSSFIESSKYSVDFKIDLDKEMIQLNGQSSNVSLEAATAAFKRKITLPFTLHGNGVAYLVLEGPLKFNELSYDFQTQIKQGRIDSEDFQNLKAHITSKNGHVKADEFLLNKGKSLVQLQGSANPSGEIDVTINTTPFYIDDFKNAEKMVGNISGLLNLDIHLTQHILKPQIDAKWEIKDLHIEEQSLSDSSGFFSLNTDKGILESSSKLFGSSLITQFQLPIPTVKSSENKKQVEIPFTLSMTSKDFDYKMFFSFLGAKSFLSEYETQLTGDLNLKSSSGDPFLSTGKGTLEKFTLKRGPLELKNQEPILFFAHQGVGKFYKFNLVGLQNHIQIDSNGFSRENFNVTVKSDLELKLLQLFFPFLEELNGKALSSISFNGDIFKPEIYGTTHLEKGLVKLRDFPHPFEKLSAEVQFSRSKIMIEQIQGSVGGGQLTGRGEIQIQDFQDLPTKINFQLTNTTLNIPDGIQTTGDANLNFTGNWFPFLISGVYTVNSGKVTYEVGETDDQKTVKQSSFLPRSILKSDFSPIVLDLSVEMQKPIAVKNNLIDGSIQGNIIIQGSPNSPLIKGKIDLEKGSKFVFKDKIFDVDIGNLQFNDPKEINPNLYLAARSRVNDYDISLLIQGTAHRPQILLSSAPPLSDQDIVSLLVFGVLSSRVNQKISGDTEKKNQTALENSIAEIFTKNINKGLEKTFGVNVSFSSFYDDNKNVAVQKITLQRKLSEKLKASASQIRGDQTSTEVKLNYSLNPNVSAIGSWENRESSTTTNSITDTQQKSESIFGLDLEYKKEFR